MTTSITPNLGLIKPNTDEPIPNFFREVSTDNGQNAANLNALDAILHHLNGTYTPTWTAQTTNPTLGNGSISGKYWRLWPNLVVAHVRLVFGSTTTVGSGGYRFSLPFAIHGSYPAPSDADLTSLIPCGKAVIDDVSSADTSCTGVVVLGGSSHANIWSEQAGNSLVQHDNPVAWATGDEILFQAVYMTGAAF